MPSQPVSAHRALASDKRMAMVRMLQRLGRPVGADEISLEVGLHVNTVREHLDRLIESGLVTTETERRRTRGRPRILYSATAELEEPNDARARDQLIRALLAGYSTAGATPPDAADRSCIDEAAEPAEPAEECGRAWAAQLGHESPPPGHDQVVARAQEARRQLDDLRRHLEDLGFAPEADPDSMQVHLHRCPFLDLVGQSSDVMCQVHLGLSRGVLEQHDGPIVAEWLERFVGPHHCVLHLAERAQPEDAAHS